MTQGLRVRRLVLGALDTNCWVVTDASGGGIVIDPAGDADALLAEVGSGHIAAIVLTHGHFDHLGAATALAAATGAPVCVHAADADSITDARANGGAMFGFDAVAPAAGRRLSDGDLVAVGALGLSVIHTPGHTPGSICLHGAGHLFSGDTLFAGGVGRTDFPGGDGRALRASIARLAGLPAETLVHPGHGPDTTLAREARTNVFWPRA